MNRNAHIELKKQMDFIEKDFDMLLNSLKSFDNHDVDLPINKNALENFPLLKWVEVNKKVHLRRRNNLFHYYLNFDTVMKKGGSLGKHFHKDLIESVEVIEGILIDKHTGKEYKEHDVIYYRKNELHEPKALEDCLLKVLFKP